MRERPYFAGFFCRRDRFRTYDPYRVTTFRGCFTLLRDDHPYNRTLYEHFQEDSNPEKCGPPAVTRRPDRPDRPRACSKVRGSSRSARVRSRPLIKAYLTPSPVRPGDDLRVELQI